MTLLTIKTGWERYNNKLYTANVYMSNPSAGILSPLSSYLSYIPYHTTECGPGGRLGIWQMGGINIDAGQYVILIVTRKTLVIVPNMVHRDNHRRTQYLLRVCERGRGRDKHIGLKNWGYNGGETYNVFVSGRVITEKQIRDRYDLTVPYEQLPF